jgi:hypothetical protein
VVQWILCILKSLSADQVIAYMLSDNMWLNGFYVFFILYLNLEAFIIVKSQWWEFKSKHMDKVLFFMVYM